MSVIKDIYEIFKEVKALAKEMNNAELSFALIDLYEKINQIQEENKEIKEKLKLFQNNKAIAKNIVRTNGLVGDYTDEKNQNIKICLHCWDKHKEIIQVEPSFTNHYRCSQCATDYFYGEKEIQEDYGVCGI